MFNLYIVGRILASLLIHLKAIASVGDNKKKMQKCSGKGEGGGGSGEEESHACSSFIF